MNKEAWLTSLVFPLLVIPLFSCNDSINPMSESDSNVEKEVLAEGFEIPWAIEVIDEEDFLFTERMGALYRYQHGEAKEVTGLPESKTYTVDRQYALLCLFYYISVTIFV